MKDNALPFLVEHPAKFPGDQFQIDQTQLQIGYRNENGELAFLYMVCVLDICSRKLVGYALGDRQGTELFAEALRMSFRNCNYLPAEILSDNFFYNNQNDELQDLIEQTTLLRVKWPIYLPARRHIYKSYIETFFHIFHTVYCKTSTGYVGQRIKWMLEYASRSDLSAGLLKKGDLKTKQELIDHFIFLANCYNQEVINQNTLSPSEVYAAVEKPNVIALGEINCPLIFYRKTFQEVYNATIKLKVGNQIQYYKLIRPLDIRKINERNVQIRYHEEDVNYIYVYTKESEFLAKIVKVNR